MSCDVQLEVELSGNHLTKKKKDDHFCSLLQNVFSPGEHGGDGLRSWGWKESVSKFCWNTKLGLCLP